MSLGDPSALECTCRWVCAPSWQNCFGTRHPQVDSKRTESCRTAPPTPSTENKTTLAGAEENDTGKDRRSLNACLLGSCSLTAPGPEDGGGSPVGSPLREGRATVQLPHIQSPRGRPNGRGTSRRRHGEGGVDRSPAHVTPNEGPRPSAPEAAHSPPAACRAPGAGPQETESWTG